MIKEYLKRLAKNRGYEIVGAPLAYAAQRTLIGLIRQQQINLVLDVGANEGQFAGELRASGYSGRIISFEPQASAHEKLRSNAAVDPHWTIADRTALGAEKGSVEFHISGNSVSSSILDMLPSHSQAAAESCYVGTETVPVNRLDDVCVLSPTDRVLLKVDVQGYERQVLDGAKRVLGGSSAVIVEMSLVPLYEGQVLAREMWDLLAAEGFDAWSLEPIMLDPATGRMLQIDGTFVRKSL